MSKAIKRKIGETIKNARKSCGMSQIELAKMIGHKSATYISYIERGERNISAVDFIRILEVTGKKILHDRWE